MVYVGKSGWCVVLVFIVIVYVQEMFEVVKGQWCKVVDQLRFSVFKFVKLMDMVEEDVFVYMLFLLQYCIKLYSMNLFECLNGEIK